MMNREVFATIVSALTDLDDTQGAQVLSVIQGFRSMTSAPVTPAHAAPAPAQAPAPVKERKPLAPPTAVSIPITPVKAGKGKVAFTLGYGAGREGAKIAIKDAGFAWDTYYADDKIKGAWVGTSAQAKALGITSKSTAIDVSAEYVQKGRAKAAAKAARKAARA